MKLYDYETGEVIAEITTNRSMSIDEALDLMGYTVNDEGQIIDNGEALNAWYDNLEMDYTDESSPAPMSDDEVYTVACSLYDGGWRASDREDLDACPDYQWGEGDVEKVCGILQGLEAAEIVKNGLYESAVALMDDDIREAVHADLAPCTEEEFLAEYMKRHEEKFGSPFAI